jgi:hypothetical protein
VSSLEFREFCEVVEQHAACGICLVILQLGIQSMSLLYQDSLIIVTVIALHTFEFKALNA